ncbi:MAG: hypothetical protein Q8L47_05495 [bacterium]|nr:hypothetical protein [bacterium]
MRNLRVIDAELKRLREGQANELNILRDEQLIVIRQSLILCVKCSKKSKLSLWTFIQNLWLVPADGYEGSYWDSCEIETCHIACPRCGAENYICTHSQKDKVINLCTSYSFKKEKIFQKVIERKDKN